MSPAAASAASRWWPGSTWPSALAFEPQGTWDHFRHQRLDGLLDLVTEERDHLDDLFLQMKDLVTRYESNTMKHSVMGDTPRKAYRRTSEVILGKKVWELINDEYGRKVPGLALDSLIDHDNVPWEELINTDRPEVRGPRCCPHVRRGD